MSTHNNKNSKYDNIFIHNNQVPASDTILNNKNSKILLFTNIICIIVLTIIFIVMAPKTIIDNNTQNETKDTSDSDNISDIESEHQYESPDYYDEIYRPYSIEDCLDYTGVKIPNYTKKPDNDNYDNYDNNANFNNNTLND